MLIDQDLMQKNRKHLQRFRYFRRIRKDIAYFNEKYQDNKIIKIYGYRCQRNCQTK